MSAPAVAILDIGSNSIKVLVASRAEGGGLTPLLSKSVDARISAGISAEQPRLSEEGMARGLAAIQELLAAAAPFSPVRAVLVATSAVRDAANGAEFRERVRAASGFEIRILTGEQEANAIGRGLTTDPALAALQNFYVFDLGGGSLECLAFQGRRIAQAASLQLGCVRLTEKFVADPTAPFPGKARARIMTHVKETLQEADFRFYLPDGEAVATGGTVSSVRAIYGAKAGRDLAATPPIIPTWQLQQLLDELGPMPLAQRRQVAGLPPARADVFPAALATLLAVAEAGGISTFHHSLHNLRFGLADETLAGL
jgi:exopolyphosphatase/guanosine-5'-triphosphate,3'-diphosphate pyrophosphatase